MPRQLPRWPGSSAAAALGASPPVGRLRAGSACPGLQLGGPRSAALPGTASLGGLSPARPACSAAFFSRSMNALPRVGVLPSPTRASASCDVAARRGQYVGGSTAAAGDPSAASVLPQVNRWSVVLLLHSDQLGLSMPAKCLRRGRFPAVPAAQATERENPRWGAASCSGRAAGAVGPCAQGSRRPASGGGPHHAQPAVLDCHRGRRHPRVPHQPRQAVREVGPPRLLLQHLPRQLQLALAAGRGEGGGAQRAALDRGHATWRPARSQLRQLP